MQMFPIFNRGSARGRRESKLTPDGIGHERRPCRVSDSDERPAACRELPDFKVKFSNFLGGCQGELRLGKELAVL